MSFAYKIQRNDAATHTVKYENELGFVRTVWTGDIDLGDVRKFVTKTANALNENECRRLLTDARDLDLNMSIFEIYRVPTILREANFPGVTRGAILVSEKIEKHSFFVMVANNFGQTFKIFTDPDEAVAWLNA